VAGAAQGLIAHNLISKCVSYLYPVGPTLPSAGPPPGRSGLDCLDPGRFRFGRPRFEGWKSLDFLGFSRSNRDFSMGCARFSATRISRAFPGRRGPRNGGNGPGVKRIDHEASLSWLLISRKRLFEIVVGGSRRHRRPAGRLRPPRFRKQAAPIGVRPKTSGFPDQGPSRIFRRRSANRSRISPEVLGGEI